MAISFQFGLSLDKTLSDAMNPYLDSHQDRCILDEQASSLKQGPIIFFQMDFSRNLTTISCSKDWRTLHIYKNRTDIPITNRISPGMAKMGDSSLFMTRRRRRDATPENGCSQVTTLPLKFHRQGDIDYYSFQFILFIASEQEEGLYNLYFHSCPNYNYPPQFPLSFTVDIEENNRGNYLSAGEMPLPALYFMMATLFLLSGLFWVFILRKSKHPVFKIHYLMAALVFLKSLSLLFHAINFHFIEIRGEHTAWAILYYITHL